MFAFLVFSQTVSADGSISSVYERGFELAEQTYTESSQVLTGRPAVQTGQDPVTGTTDVSNKSN
jgi:hypothetical protein